MSSYPEEDFLPLYTDDPGSYGTEDVDSPENDEGGSGHSLNEYSSAQNEGEDSQSDASSNANPVALAPELQALKGKCSQFKSA